MKNVKLIALELTNFKGIRKLVLAANGADLDIYGDNGTGKTTIADAFYWLLFGKDSLGRSDFEIKTLDESGQPINFLDHTVFAALNIDGEEITLEKTLREKWVKQRGSVDREFQGHETEYLINGIPKSKGEYTAFVKSIADEDIFKLLTNPMYFNNTLDKKKRREMLFSIFGDVSDTEVIAANSALLGDLAGLLGKHTIDELRTATGAQKRRINNDLQAIPNRIDEASRYINTEITGDVDILRGIVEKVDADIERKTEELRNLTADTEADAYRQKVEDEIRALTREKQIEIGENEYEYKQLCAEADRARETVSRLYRELSNCKGDALEKQAIEELNDRLSRLRAEWQTVFDTQYTGDEKCPTCGQDLPASQIEEARNRFNERKATTIKSIEAEAERIKAAIKRSEDSITANAAYAEKINAEYMEAHSVLHRAVDKTDAAKAKLDLLKKEAATAIQDKRNALAEWENSRKAGEIVNEGRKVLQEEIEALKAKKRAIEADIYTLKNNEVFKARVSELEADAKRLTAEYERLEREDFLIAEFTRIKASMLEEKINSKFKYAKFKLFDRQINGGIVETCEVTYNGVPYSVLNNAMRINIGLDIISAFSEYYGLSAVIFLDNAESVTNIFKTESQQVRLYVSAADKCLRIEQNN